MKENVLVRINIRNYTHAFDNVYSSSHKAKAWKWWILLKFMCRWKGHKYVNRKLIMHTYCLRCGHEIYK